MEGMFAVQAVMSLVDNITGPMRAVEGQLAATEGRVVSLGQRMGMLAKSMLPVAAVAGVLLLGLGAMTSKAIAFEGAMADVNKVLDLSNQEYQAMSQDILDLSTRIPMVADGLAAIVEAAGQSGVAKADLLGFAEQAAKMGVAFGMSGDQAGKTMSDWRAGMGLTLERTYALADAANHLSNNMNATAPALSEVIQRAGALAMTAGLAETQVAALGAAILAAGATPEVAATGLRKFTSTLVLGSAMSDRQAAAFRSLGFSARQMAKDMQTDAQGTILQVMQALANKPKELQVSLLTEMFGELGQAAIAPLLANTGLLSQAFELVGDQANYAGSMQAEFDTRAATVGNTLILLRNRLNAIGIVIGTAVLPLVGAAAQVLGVLADGLLILAKTPVGQALVTVAGVLAAAVVGIAAFAAASWAASAVLPILGGALAAVSWPIWAIVAAVAVLALAWRANFGGMADRLTAWWANVQLVYQGVVAVFGSLEDGVGTVQGQLAQDIEAAGLVGAVTTVARLAYRIRELGIGIWRGISGVATATWAVVGPILDALGSAVQAVAGWLGLMGAATAEAGAATDVATWQAWGEALGGIVATIAVGYAVVQAFKILQIGLIAVTKLWAAAQWLLNAAFLASPIGWIVLGVAALAGVVALVYAYWEPISGFFGRVFSAIGQAFSGFFDAVGSLATRFWAWLADLFYSFHPLGIIISNWEPIKTWFSELWDWFAGFNLYESGAALIATFWDGIKGRASGLYADFREFLGPLARYLPSSDAREGPLSSLTASGAAIPDTLGQGVRSAAPRLAATMAGALGGLAIVAAPAPALADAPAAPEIRVEAPAPERGGRQPRQIIIQGMQVHLHGVQDADDFLSRLARLVEGHDG